ncbi:hypothetical protein A2U01_0111849, partial [Trifolium medium]|nr:hypothetical protein [Trifolium medium]
MMSGFREVARDEEETSEAGETARERSYN